jgi:ribosome-associated translation inhibitor RaiA
MHEENHMIERFYFRNFDATDAFNIYANTMLSQVMESAPADSTSLATVVKVGDKFKARIEIFSCDADFSAFAEGDTPELAIDDLSEKISKQIGRWRNNRFDEHGLKLWPLNLKNIFSKSNKQGAS